MVSVHGEENPRAGSIAADDREKPTHVKSSLVKWESETSELDRNKAVRIVENVQGLEAEIRGQIVKMLRRV